MIYKNEYTDVSDYSGKSMFIANDNIKPNNIKSILYNHYIIFNTYKIAIIDVLNNKFNFVSQYFSDEINNEFKKKFNQLKNDLLSYQITIGDEFIPHDIIYFMKPTTISFIDLTQLFNKLKY